MYGAGLKSLLADVFFTGVTGVIAFRRKLIDGPPVRAIYLDFDALLTPLSLRVPFRKGAMRGFRRRDRALRPETFPPEYHFF